jgi:hypothetical protein
VKNNRIKGVIRFTNRAAVVVAVILTVLNFFWQVDGWLVHNQPSKLKNGWYTRVQESLFLTFDSGGLGLRMDPGVGSVLQTPESFGEPKTFSGSLYFLGSEEYPYQDRSELMGPGDVFGWRSWGFEYTEYRIPMNISGTPVSVVCWRTFTLPYWPIIAIWFYLVFVSGWWRKKRRRIAGLCIHCGYDLVGCAAGIECPECGGSRWG